MLLKDAIGIDPDSKGFVCCMVKREVEKVIFKEYSVTGSDIKKFTRWIKNEKEVTIAIEGGNGQSKPIEKALKAEGIIFYSFTPYSVSKFRKAVLGQNKNNKNDAEAVARLAMSLESQGKLNNYRRVYFPDESLQGLTRSYERKSKMMTQEMNSLWKLIKTLSVELYLALGGRNPDIEITENILANNGIMSLLSLKPDIYEWKNLSEEDFLKAMNSRNYKGCQKHIQELKKVSEAFQPISAAAVLMLNNSASQILFLKKQMNEIVRMLKAMTEKNKAVNALEEYRGISTITACNFIAEIIDIRRFMKDDNLASYAGLTLHEHSTGDKESTRYNVSYNHRLKDTFMTAAKNYVQYNPDSHLTGYYKNLLKGSMPVTEARKRVARALVRVIYKKLNSIISEEKIPVIEKEDDKKNSVSVEGKIQKGSDMARGSSLGDINNPSNISLPSEEIHLTGQISYVKENIISESSETDS